MIKTINKIIIACFIIFILAGCEDGILDESSNIIEYFQEDKIIIQEEQVELILEGSRDEVVQLDSSDISERGIITRALAVEDSTQTGNTGSRAQNGSWWYDGASVNHNIKLDVDGDGKTDNVQLKKGYVIVTRAAGTGAFKVYFRPWKGYAIPNGYWIVGDYNGDGKDDLAHLVNKANYVHIWFSKGNGSFRVTSFSPWSGYAITNGAFMAADFNGDGKDDLIHLVRSDYVHTWFSKGDGSFRVTTFRPWPGYVIMSGHWKLANLNGDGKKDLVHFCCPRYFHTWISRGNGTYIIGTVPR